MKKYRLLPLIEDDGRMQMAIDEAITIACSEKKSPPTLRFYVFSPPAITLGYGQSISNFNLEEMGKRFEYVRRMTGGTAVLHKNDLIYSLILPEDSLPHTIVDAYNYLSDGLVMGLKKLGLNAEKKYSESKERKDSCYLNSNPYDIIVNGKKISGNAQARSNDIVLQHGTIIVENNLNELIDCMFLDEEKKLKLLNRAKNKVTYIQKELKRDISISELEKAMLFGFEELFKQKGIAFERGDLTNYEKQLIKNLYIEKYSTEEWNNLR